MTRPIAGLIAWSAVVAIVGAQTPPRDAAPVAVPTGTASLAGVIRDETDQPLRRVTVSIAGDMRLSLSTVTGDDGQFSFTSLPAGRFTIKAEKPAYPNVSYGGKRPNRPGAGILLAAGQQATGLVIKLARGGVLAGTVYDDRGQPMPGVPIMAWEVRTSLAGERTLDFPITGGVSVTSDDQGRYRVYGLPPGEYTVGTAWFFGSGRADVRVPTDAEIRAAFQALTQPVAQAGASAPPPPAASPQMYSYTAVFHPNAVDPMAAITVPLAAGEERLGLDLHMQFQPMSRVEGTVVGPDGPAANAQLSLGRRSTVQALNSTSVWSSGPDGTFLSSSLAPGDYTLRAEVQKSGDQPAMFALTDVSIAGAAPLTVTLRLEPAMTVTGRLVFEGNTLTPPTDLTRVRITLFPATQGQDFGTNATPAIDPSGTFSINGVRPSTVRVIANVPNPSGPAAPGWTLKSVMFGPRDVTDLPLELTGGDLPPLTITFTDQVAELSGTITDTAGQPATDYFIIVIPAEQKYWTLQSRRIANTRPDVRGHFVFRGLPPGDYRISATTDLVARDLQEVGTLTTLAAQSTPVTIGVGEKKAFDLRVGR